MRTLTFLSTLLFFLVDSRCSIAIESTETTQEQNQNQQSDFETQLLSFDQNRDGKLQKSELPESSHNRFDEWDFDRNAMLDKKELQALIHFAQHGELPAGFRCAEVEDGGFVLDEDAHQSEFSNLTVGEFVGRALAFDKNDDGVLDKNELIRFATTVAQVERFNQANGFRYQQGVSRQISSRARPRSAVNSPYLSKLHNQVQLPPARRASRNSAVRPVNS